MGESAATAVARALPKRDQLRKPEDAEGVLHWILTGGGSRLWHTDLKYGNDKLQVNAYR